MSTNNKGNNDSNTSSSSLPLNALDQIPQVKSDAMEITGLTKESGKITGYQLSNGNIVSKEEGVRMAQNGEIKGVGIAHNGDTVYLKSLPDDNEYNNLGNMPTVSSDKLY